MNAKSAVYLSIVLFCLCAGPCFGKGAPDAQRVDAIQERIFHRNHEISLSLGYIPDDDFYHAYPVGLAYTYHFNHLLAWEVIRGQVFVNMEKDLKKDLEENFGVTPQEFEEPLYMFHTCVVLKPFYGKDAVWNGGILNHESSFSLGAGLVTYENQYSYGDPDTQNVASLCIGYAVKYFLSKNLCLNLEVRDLVNFREDKTVNDVYLGLGFSLRFNLAPRKNEEDDTVRKLRKYIEESRSHDE
ncbi:MAG: outer membrane beta-barrel domain-containing protein [Desulfomonilia bacterium]